MKYVIVPLSEMMLSWLPEEVERFLGGFTCKRDKELESFLHTKAVEYEKRDLARTFILISENKIIGYFSLANTVLEIKEGWPISNTLKKKMNAADGPIAAYLIGQMSKADDVNEKVGGEMIGVAMSMINEMRKIGGGRVVCVDCKRELLKFYEENGFKIISNPSEDGLYRMVRLFS